MASRISNYLATLLAEAAKAALDGGHVRIFSGAEPATVDAAQTGVLLAEFTLPSPAFGAVTNGVMNANGITPQTWLATGTAGYWRGYDVGSPEIPLCQGKAGTASAEMILNSVSATVGGSVSINSWVWTQNKS